MAKPQLLANKSNNLSNFQTKLQLHLHFLHNSFQLNVFTDNNFNHVMVNKFLTLKFRNKRKIIIVDSWTMLLARKRMPPHELSLF